jgi:Spy/CpxP family protein refolding chaperone
MKTSRNIITILLLTLFNIASYAQERQLTEEQKEQVKEQLEQYFEKLDLSQEQKPKFEEITKKYALQMKNLKTSGKSKFAKYKEYKSIKGSKNKEMIALLSAEQFKIYKETQKEILKKIKEKRRNRN